MKQFRLIHGNQLEMLSEMLSRILKTPLSSPLEPEILIVQSQGMSRWLTMEIAGHLGISANLKFFYPNEFIRFAFHRILPDFSDSPLNDPAIVTWKLMKLLPEFMDNRQFVKIRNYLNDDVSGVKQFQLASRMADTFDQYLLFRPEMMLEWEKGKDDNWQAEIWRTLAREGDTKHRARQIQTLKEFCRQQQFFPADFPERITVFGISALPRFHMELFDILSHFTQVNLFLMNPCREYWGDILSNREMARKTKLQSRSNVSTELLYLEQGNPLLAATGTMGRDFFDMIHSFGCEEIDIFQDPGRDTLLHHIQSDILELRGNPAEDFSTIGIPATDHSVSIHSCHSPMRELEVLHNHVLSFFEKDETLAPDRILVMTPDIETYAPYIDAVFNLPKDDHRWIPYRIADRSMLSESMMIKTFFAILDMHNSRFRLTEVMGILESPDVKFCFDLSENDLELIRKWVTETRIRWGMDSNFRKNIGLPEIHENTWEAGIERLLLGYAMLAREDRIVEGILPYDPIEGSSADTLGKFLEFIHRLFATVQSLQISRAIPDWIQVFENLVTSFFQSTESSEKEIHAMREIWTALRQQSEQADFHQKLSIEVVKKHLSNILGKKASDAGFIAGGITFSAMLPMRSIPFDVICLLGMNHDAYPRQTRAAEFDLISQNPRPGDRSRRNDDQYLFLESILSARKILYISYIGKSVQDNKIIPPSVLVSELLQYIETRYSRKNSDNRLHVFTEQKLQPFHPIYFNASLQDSRPSPFFSYSEQDLKGAVSLQSNRTDPAPFFTDELPVPETTEIEFQSLLRFFVNPCRYIVNKQLGIFLSQDEKILDDREPFSMEALNRYQLSHSILEQMILGADHPETLARTRAAGILPHRRIGEAVFDEVHDRANEFYRNLKPHIQQEKYSPIPFQFQIENQYIKGKIDSVYPDYAFFYRYGMIQPKDLLASWLNHLILNHAGPDHYPKQTVVAGLSGASAKDAAWSEIHFAPVDNAGELLTSLMDYYLTGLRKPLKLFPRTSYRYADLVLNRNMHPEEALEKAGTVFTGNDFSSGEMNDLYCRFCFKNISPLDEEFRKIAVDLFQPMMASEKQP
ncbi:MAG: exodeoxyribonuclease V subunit gamma [Desulfobacterium sp.]|nr:exodeoxyribonuclease V subunit gamma [Desulfobacterium sp.]